MGQSDRVDSDEIIVKQMRPREHLESSGSGHEEENYEGEEDEEVAGLKSSTVSRIKQPHNNQHSFCLYAIIALQFALILILALVLTAPASSNNQSEESTPLALADNGTLGTHYTKIVQGKKRSSEEDFEEERQEKQETKEGDQEKAVSVVSKPLVQLPENTSLPVNIT